MQHPMQYSGPQCFGHRDPFHGRQFCHRWELGGAVRQRFRRSHERWGEADEASLTHPPAAHLLLYSSIPNKPRTNTGLQPRGCGLLM